MLLRYSASVLKSSRSDIQHLTLVAVTVHFFNSIHAHLGTMNWDRKLAKVVFPTATFAQGTVKWDYMLWTPRKKHEAVPMVYRGALWLPRIVYPKPREGDVLRFEYNGYRVDQKLIADLFNMDWARIKQIFLPSFMIDPYASGELCRRRCGPSSDPIKRRIQLPDTVTDFSVKRPRVLYHDAAPDLPRESQIGRAPSGANRRNASEFCLGILSQIMQRVGTTRSHVPYCNLTDVQRRAVSFETFHDMNLSTYFMSFQYTTSQSDWTSLKTMLFPGPHDTPPFIGDSRIQGWNRIPLYMEFLALRDTNSSEFQHLHQTCIKLFDTLKWFVKVQRDKLMDYKRRPSWQLISAGNINTGVPIAFNPKFAKHCITAQHQSPVLDQNALHALDEAKETLWHEQEAHQAVLPPLAHAVYGVGSRWQNLDEAGQLPDRQTVAYARARAHRRNGYLDPDMLDPDLSETEVEAILTI